MGEQDAFFFTYLPLEISLISKEKALLPPYLGSTLRGAIGQALYFHTTNSFRYLYKNGLLSNSRQDIVNPYVIISPVLKEGPYQVGEELRFGLLLLGDASKHVEPLLGAMYRLQQQGLGASRYPFTLKKVVHPINQRLIWEGKFLNPIATESTLLPWRSLPDVRQVTVNLWTPLRIRRNGKLIEQLDFPTIIRNITSRIEALTARYGGWVDREEIKRIQTISTRIAMVENNLYFKTMERYSNRQGQKQDFGGLMGTVRFEGDLTPFVPWLYAAQTLHIGRNTTFGMGRVGVEFL